MTGYSSQIYNIDRKTRVGQLSEAFPGSPNTRSKLLFRVRQSAAECGNPSTSCKSCVSSKKKSCSQVFLKHAQMRNCFFASTESVVERPMANVKTDDYSLTVDRDEVWRGALIFNKKALTNSNILRKNLTIFFKG